MPKLDTAQRLGLPVHAPERAHVPSQTLAHGPQYSRSGLFDRGRFRQDLRDRVLHAEAFLCALALSDVRGRADIAEEGTVGSEAGGALIEQPAILAVVPPQAIFECKGAALVEAMGVSLEASLAIARVNVAGPAVTQLFLEDFPRQIEPGLTHIGAELVGVRSPNQHRRGVRHRTEALFAFPQRFLFLAALLDHGGKKNQRNGDGEQEHLQGQDALHRRECGKGSEALGRPPDRHENQDQERSARCRRAEAQRRPKKKRQRQEQERRRRVALRVFPGEKPAR